MRGKAFSSCIWVPVHLLQGPCWEQVAVPVAPVSSNQTLRFVSEPRGDPTRSKPDTRSSRSVLFEITEPRGFVSNMWPLHKPQMPGHVSGCGSHAVAAAVAQDTGLALLRRRGRSAPAQLSPTSRSLGRIALPLLPAQDLPALRTLWEVNGLWVWGGVEAAACGNIGAA